MKILELTNFSAGICGVWQRVKQESIELAKKNHKVLVLSSNIEKGTNRIVPLNELINKIKIKRFHTIKLGGESFMYWFGKEAMRTALDFQPDIILVHVYRHLHTTKALKIAGKLKKQGKICKVFLVTHAPFVKDNSTRSFFGKIVVNFYDKFISPRIINKFDRVIAITKWEMPYLFNLGCRKEKIIYIPNGIPEEFFNKKTKKGEGILFLGRISPIKNLEILIKVIKDLKINLDIVGQAEEYYKKKLLNLIKEGNIKNIRFYSAVYDLKRKIQIIDKHEIFIIPSRREAMPQSLIEVMARGKLVISSNTQGGKEIIDDGKNGFLFEIGNEKQLTEIIRKILSMPEKEKTKIMEEARKKAEDFKLEKLIRELERLF